MLKAILLSAPVCLFSLNAFADGSEAPPAPHVKSVAGATDRRLPPILPGQEVTDGAKRMNVWSTSGSVSAAEAPDPFRRNAPAAPQVPQVIVDERRLGIEGNLASN